MSNSKLAIMFGIATPTDAGAVGCLATFTLVVGARRMTWARLRRAGLATLEISSMILLLVTVGMFLDGVSIFLIFVPLLLPIVQYYKWDPVWFGVILTLKVALGQFTPPLAVNLMVSCRIAMTILMMPPTPAAACA